MAGPEATIERLCRALVDATPDARMEKVRFLGRRNCPDNVLFVGGSVAGDPVCLAAMVEFKAPGEHPTHTQSLTHEELRADGVDVWVIDEYDMFREFLENLLNALR